MYSEYMGFKIQYQDSIPFVTIDNILHDIYESVNNWAKYNSSWDWLLPVWKKLDNDCRGKFISERAKIMMLICDVNIEKAFIKIFNLIRKLNYLNK